MHSQATRRELSSEANAMQRTGLVTTIPAILLAGTFAAQAQPAASPCLLHVFRRRSSTPRNAPARRR
jgi:hypothetical protein